MATSRIEARSNHDLRSSDRLSFLCSGIGGISSNNHDGTLKKGLDIEPTLVETN